MFSSRKVRLTALIGAVLVCLAAMAIVGGANADGPTGDQQAQQEINAATPQFNLSDDGSPTLDRSPRGMTGTPPGSAALDSTITAIKADVANDIVADSAVMRGTVFPSDAGTQVSAAWIASKAAGILSDDQTAFNWAKANDPTFPYTDNRLVVSSWDRVTVDGTSATAVFEGHAEFLATGIWSTRTDQQFQTTLQLEGGKWKLASLGMVDPTDNAG